MPSSMWRSICCTSSATAIACAGSCALAADQVSWLESATASSTGARSSLERRIAKASQKGPSTRDDAPPQLDGELGGLGEVDRAHPWRAADHERRVEVLGTSSSPPASASGLESARGSACSRHRRDAPALEDAGSAASAWSETRAAGSSLAPASRRAVGAPPRRPRRARGRGRRRAGDPRRGPAAPRRTPAARPSASRRTPLARTAACSACSCWSVWLTAASL